MSFAALDDLDFPALEPGSVWLVGAGPGAPGPAVALGYHALQQADVVVYDALVSDKLLALATPAAERIHAGKRGGKPSPVQADISLRLIELARAGRKGGAAQGRRSLHVRARRRGGRGAGPRRHQVPHRAGHFLGARRARLCRHSGDASRHQPGGDLPDRPRRDRRAAAGRRLGRHRQCGPGHRHVHGGQASRRHRAKADRRRPRSGRPARRGQPRRAAAAIGGRSEPRRSRNPRADLETPALVVLGPVSRYREMLDWYGAAERENSYG